MAQRCIIFAGGGSGGHISPGLAIAERLAEISPASKSIFICSNRAIDATMLTEAGAIFVPVPATPPAHNPIAAWRFLQNFSRSKKIIRSVIRDRNVDRVVLLGGFVAAPSAVAARSLNIPVMLVNLDAPPGKANRWMAKRSDQVISAIAIPTMPAFASQIVGMPIRRRAIAPADANQCRSRLNLPVNLNTLLITGASQGATSINAFMIALTKSNPQIFNGWHILHLAGHGADNPIRDAYRTANISATVLPFLDHIGLAWGAADLAISRAGASSVAEVAANAVPTLFLPYPYHKDMHQKHNAQPLVDFGGAAMAIDLIEAEKNLQTIGPILRQLMTDTTARQSMRNKHKSNPPPDAAMTIAKMLLA